MVRRPVDLPRLVASSGSTRASPATSTPCTLEHEEGVDAFRLEMASALSSYLSSDRQYRRPIVEARYGDAWEMFDGVTYAEGGLRPPRPQGPGRRRRLGGGGSGFTWRPTRTSNVATDDFRKAMEKASGRDLAWFFDQWVFRGGHPELSARWRFEDDDKTVRLKVEQTQAGRRDDPPVPPAHDGRAWRRVGPPPTSRSSSTPGPTSSSIPATTRPNDGPDRPRRAGCPKVLDLREAGRGVDRISSGTPPTSSAGSRPPGPWPEPFKAEKIGLPRPWPKPGPCEKAPQAPRRAGPPGRGARAKPCRDALIAAIEGPRGPREGRGDRGAVQPSNSTRRPRRFSGRPGQTRPKPMAPAGPTLQALARAKVKDADELIASALNGHRAGRHTILARTALQVVLDEGGRKSREAAVLYSRPGQPFGPPDGRHPGPGRSRPRTTPRPRSSSSPWSTTRSQPPVNV